MPAAKTYADPQPKTAPTAAPTQQPVLPEKQAGPLRSASIQRAAAAPPPPDEAAARLANPAMGAVQRARAMRSMQGSIGSARVSRMLETSAPRIQRTCACGGESGPDGECAACKAKRLAVQRQASTPEMPDRLPTSVTAAMQAGGGQPLDRAARAQLEPAFGADFGGVRVHTGPQADRAARDINAKAFTTGQHIFFGAGQYQPGTPTGDRLLAHELTHTIQQGSGAGVPQAAGTISQPGEPAEQEAERVAEQVTANMPAAQPTTSPRPGLLQRQDAPANPPAPPAGVDDAVNAIMKDLEGPTPWWASERILNQFKGKDATWVRAVLQGLKNKAGDGVIEWLFGDLTAEDSRELRRILVAVGVVEDLARITAALVKDRLEGYTSESDSLEIYTSLAEFKGAQVDQVLRLLEQMTGKSRADMAAWLFGDMDRVNAERTRQLLFGGGDVGLEYAATWTASKIYDLLSGYTSHADSSSIAWNFEQTPLEARKVVLQRLDVLTREKRSQSAEDSLMEDMDQSDYEKLRMIGGLELRPFEDKRGALEKIVSGAEWALVVSEWVVCGAIGIITGVLAALWDIVAGVWDIGKAAWHLLWSLIYLISGGTAGSENWLAVKDFFRGLKALGSPGKLWDDYWEGLKLEFKTIEGPLTDCRQAEFIVRKFATAVVNILLIFLAGYGLVKGAISAARTIAALAELAELVGVLRTLAVAGRLAGRAVLRFVAVSVEEAVTIAKMFLNPIKTLVAVGRRINVVMLAVRDEGLWNFMRGRAGALTASEKQWWQQQKDSWKVRGERQQNRHAALSDDADQINAALQDQKAPENHADVAKRMEDDANALDDEVKNLEKDMTSESTTHPELSADIERERILIREKLGQEGAVREVTDPELLKKYDVEITVGDHTYRRTANGTWCRFSDGPACGISLGVDLDLEVSKVLDKKLRRPGWRQSEVDVGTHLGPDWEAQASFYEGRRVEPSKFGSVRPDYYNSQLNIAVEVKNYDLARDYEALVAILRDQAGGRLAYMPKGVRQWLFLDVRGQNVGDLAQMAGRIHKSTGNVFEKIHFLTDKGIVAF